MSVNKLITELKKILRLFVDKEKRILSKQFSSRVRTLESEILCLLFQHRLYHCNQNSVHRASFFLRLQLEVHIPKYPYQFHQHDFKQIVGDSSKSMILFNETELYTKHCLG